MTREQAYDLVQPKTAQSWDNQVDFKPLLESDPEVTSRLTQEEIDEIFNPVYYTKRVDEIFERIGLGDYFGNKKGRYLPPYLCVFFFLANGPWLLLSLSSSHMALQEVLNLRNDLRNWS